MAEITIAYDKSVQGWTSEFSFIPDSGISLNNNYYTFNQGRIWRHNEPTDENNPRNTFYGSASQTLVSFIFNDYPSIVKNFKTISYEGDDGGAVTIEFDLNIGTSTDIPVGGVAIVGSAERYQNISNIQQNNVTTSSNFNRAGVWRRVGDGFGDPTTVSAGWDLEIETNVENAFIDTNYFVDREDKRHAYIRGENNSASATSRFVETSDYKSGVNGIGILDRVEDSSLIAFLNNINSDQGAQLNLNSVFNTGSNPVAADIDFSVFSNSELTTVLSTTPWADTVGIAISTNEMSNVLNTLNARVAAGTLAGPPNDYLVYSDDNNWMLFNGGRGADSNDRDLVAVSRVIASKGVIGDTNSLYFSTTMTDVTDFQAYIDTDPESSTFNDLVQVPISNTLHFSGNVPTQVTTGDSIFTSAIVNGQANNPVPVGIITETGNTFLRYNTVGVPVTRTDETTLTTRVPVSGEFILAVKNNIIDKSGVIGYYAIVTMTTDSQTEAELFSVNTNVFQSSN